jgi:hypothetical protein
VPHVICAFGGGEETYRGRDQLAHVVEGAWPCGAEDRLQFGKGLFDRIEVRTVRRQKPDVRPGRFNRGTDLRLLMNREVVEHDDVARPQRGHQDLFDVGAERGRVDGAIEDRRRGEPVDAQSGDDGVRLPMAARGVVMQAGAARAAAIPTQQIGGDAALIEKDVLVHIAQRLPCLPLATGRCDIRTALFVGVYRFF